MAEEAPTIDPNLTPVELVKARISAGKKFTARFSKKDRIASKRFLDSSSLQSGLDSVDEPDNDGELPEDLAEGQINYLTLNTIIKTHSITLHDPDFYVKGGDFPPELQAQALITGQPLPNVTEIVRKRLKEKWDEYERAELARAIFQQQDISGHGFAFFRWDAEKNWNCWEYAQSKDVLLDPHVTSTTWHQLRWAARKIRMPREEFLERYPDKAQEVLDHDMTILEDSRTVRQAIEVTVYWDSTSEYHLHGEETVLEAGQNLYGRVPLLQMLGEINPLSPYRLGTFDLASGVQKMHSDLQDQLNAQAKHGGPRVVINAEDETDELAKQFDYGPKEQAIRVQGTPVTDYIGVVEGGGIDAALFQAIDMQAKAADAYCGVNEYMRGVPTSDPKFASQIAAVQQHAGVRGISDQKKYERFLRAMARIDIEMFVDFGNVSDPLDFEFWQACQMVEDVWVVEASTIFRDPATEQQASMQLFQLALTAVEPMSMTGSVPNLAELWTDVLRAFNRTDIEKYLIPVAPPVEPGMEEETAEGQPAGEAVAA